MKKWVVLSCTPDSAYDFFLPIVVRLWRGRIGYEPVVVLVGTEEDWSSGHSKVVYDEIKGKERVEFFRTIPDLPDSIVSQEVRQNISALEFDVDDILMIADVDLFPVDVDFFHRYDPSKNPIGINYEPMYDGPHGYYYQAHGVVMPVRHWREVMGVTVGDLRGSVDRVFRDGKVVELQNQDPQKQLQSARDLVAAWKADYTNTRFWTFEERYTSARIKSSRFSKDVAEFPSFIGNKRTWRVKLPSKPYASDYVDFHCSRPGWSQENWPDIRHMLVQMIPEDIRWVDRYVGAYLASL